jgi:hypothetical protein
LLGPAVDNKKKIAEEEELIKEKKENDQNKYKFNWMILAEIEPNATIGCSSDLKNRDID